MGASNWWLADRIGDKNGWDNIQKISYYTALEEQDGDLPQYPKKELYKGQRRDNFLIALGVLGCVALLSVIGYYILLLLDI